MYVHVDEAYFYFTITLSVREEYVVWDWLYGCGYWKILIRPYSRPTISLRLLGRPPGCSTRGGIGE